MAKDLFQKVFFLIHVILLTAKADLIKINSDNWTQKILKEHTNMVLYFEQVDCTQCRKDHTTLNEISNLLDFQIARINCSVDAGIVCRAFSIGGEIK